jgi:hypothetical protein
MDSKDEKHTKKQQTTPPDGPGQGQAQGQRGPPTSHAGRGGHGQVGAPTKVPDPVRLLA